MIRRQHSDAAQAQLCRSAAQRYPILAEQVWQPPFRDRGWCASDRERCSAGCAKS